MPMPSKRELLEENQILREKLRELGEGALSLVEDEEIDEAEGKDENED